MTNSILVFNMKEPNGKTVRENNMEIQHFIPIGSLVEIKKTNGCSEDDDDNHGLRLFVVGHSRDCDGTPLYVLSHKKEALFTKLEKMEKDLKHLPDSSFMERSLIQANIWLLQGAMDDGYSEESLLVIR